MYHPSLERLRRLYPDYMFMIDDLQIKIYRWDGVFLDYHIQCSIECLNDSHNGAHFKLTDEEIQMAKIWSIMGS